jgi:hypothetical protein
VTRYDGIWIQRGERLVRSHEGDHGLIDEEFANDYERLYGQGHLVLLVPGKNHSLDELFFFETAADARQFYEGDLGEFECFIGDELEPCGFQEISLYEGRLRVATKSCPPSAWVGSGCKPQR